MSDPLSGTEDLIVLLVAALLPALLYLSWVRRTEPFEREPWGRILGAFAWGAFFATLVAAILEAILISAGGALSSDIPQPEFGFLNAKSPWNIFFIVLVIAPFVEEGLKAGGMIRSLGPLRSIADGPVIGASVGLGFGFFETFLYGLVAFLAGGLEAGIGLIIIRSVSSVLLHGSSTAMFGYGYAKGQVENRGVLAPAYYLVAVGMHASFNFLASLAAFLPLVGIHFVDATTASIIGFLLAVGFAFAAIEHVRDLIGRSSYPGAQGAHPRFRPPPPVRRV
ncbi:MAG: PrsW family intramembrane metalloprotease [Thermoplasmata archaeon]|nr:PrsW family intramembrane metalloprotease [Thermoplasmata archaeon]